MTQKIDATENDLLRAVLWGDRCANVPQVHVEKVTAAVVNQLGLVCLGGREVRLDLGARGTLIVRLEGRPSASHGLPG